MILMKRKNRYLIAGISGLAAVILILLIRFVDVRPIGPAGTRIGMSHLNLYVFRLLGASMLWYEITDWLGIAAIITALLFALTGLIQLIKRRSLLKVDKDIIALGGLYLLVIGFYVLFESVIVNYRPIIMPGAFKPEASFPSSHTMLVCVIMGSASMLFNQYIKGDLLRKVLRIICFACIGVTVAGRLVSGVHWFTDIVGGILISTALLALFSGITSGNEGVNHDTK